MAQWVTGAAILVQSGAYADPAGASAPDVEWSDACAAAVNAGFDARLIDAVYPSPPALPDELVWAALTAGVEAYKRREAAFGLTGYVDLQGAAIRVSRDYLTAVEPLLARYATVGIA